MLIGHGWDLHQHSKDEKLILGGVKFDEDGFTGHSVAARIQNCSRSESTRF